MDAHQYRTFYEEVFSMNIVLAQITINQNYKKNLSKILNTIENNKFDILVFPELSLTSYDLKRAIKIPNDKILDSLSEIQKNIKKNKIVIVGTLIHKKDFIYNASAVISSENISYYYKNTLTKYDSIYLNNGTDTLIFEFKNFKIGFLICRDQDNKKLIEKYKKINCNILIQQSAHYYSKDIALKKIDKNIAMPIVRAIDSSTLFCKVNAVGKNKKKLSLGNSMIVNKEGIILRQANKFQEEIIKIKIKDKKWL